MRLWRISNFADLNGNGGIMFPARWHNAGRPILYAAQSPAGALLEILVHLDREDMPDNFQLLEIEDDDASMEPLESAALRDGWRDDHSITRAIGDDWLAGARSLAMHVPSIFAPRTSNTLLNPKHADAPRMRIVSIESFPLDDRFK